MAASVTAPAFDSKKLSDKISKVARNGVAVSPQVLSRPFGALLSQRL